VKLRAYCNYTNILTGLVQKSTVGAIDKDRISLIAQKLYLQGKYSSTISWTISLRKKLFHKQS